MGLMELVICLQGINVIALYIICYKQQKRIEWHSHRIDSVQLKAQDLYYTKRDK